MSARVWLGLDPSIQSFGFAVLMHEPIGGGVPVVVGIGAWRTRIESGAKKLDDRARRVGELGASLLALVDRWKPTEAYVESLAFVPGKTSGPATSVLGRVRGLVEGICLARGIELAEVRPDVVKQAVTGRRDASKDDVARIVRVAYRLGPGDSLDATDALAVAHVGAYRRGHGMTVSSGTVSFRQDPGEDDLDGLF